MKNKFKLLIALFIMGCMVITILPLSSFATLYGSGSYEFSFDCQPHNADLTVGDITINGNKMNSEFDRFCTDNGQYTIYVDITSTSGEPRLNVNGGTSVTITLDKTEGNKYTFKIVYDMATNVQNHLSVTPQSGTPSVPTANPSDNEGNEEGAFTYTFEGESADIFINGTLLPSGTLTSEKVKYNYDSSGTVTLEIGTIFLYRLTELKVNGTDYSSQLPDTTEEMLEAFKDQRFFATIDVPYATSYAITTKSEETDREHMVVGNFLWDRRTPTSEEEVDDCLDHGDIKLVKLKYKGNTYYPGDKIFVNGTAYDWSDHIVTDKDPSGTAGGATLPAGAELTVKLVPDYGYQLVSFGPNGGSFTADSENQSEFTFEVGRGNFHLAAHFEQVADAVDAKANNIESGSIKIADNEIDTGSVVLSVNDINLSDDKVEEFASAAGDYKVSQYLGINLDQVIYKGTPNDVWTNKMDELNSEATVTLQLSDVIDADEIAIVHNIHDGEEFEIINLESYDEDANTITFKTKSFSSYAIATKKTSKVSSNTISTGDNCTNIIIAISIVAIATLGLIILIEKNKKISAL